MTERLPAVDAPTRPPDLTECANGLHRVVGTAGTCPCGVYTAYPTGPAGTAGIMTIDVTVEAEGRLAAAEEAWKQAYHEQGQELLHHIRLVEAAEDQITALRAALRQIDRDLKAAVSWDDVEAITQEVETLLSRVPEKAP